MLIERIETVRAGMNYDPHVSMYLISYLIDNSSDTKHTQHKPIHTNIHTQMMLLMEGSIRFVRKETIRKKTSTTRRDHVYCSVMKSSRPSTKELKDVDAKVAPFHV
jgi:hypothetical protein